MENIYVNVDELKQPAKDRGSKCFNKWCYLYAFVFLSLLSVSLLTGLVVICVLYHDLTERLEVSNVQDFSLTEERNQLTANLTKMSEDIVRPQTLLPDVCPTGWKKFRGSCYFPSNQSGSWDEGREDCKQRGADLVVIESSQEKDFLTTITRKYTWIGLNDREQEGSWKWVNGAPLIFTNWRKKQSDCWNGNQKCPEEDCVHIVDNSKWKALSCIRSRFWICEKKAVKSL